MSAAKVSMNGHASKNGQVEDISELNEAQLWARFEHYQTLSRECMIEAGQCVVALDKLGTDMSRIRTQDLALYRKIGRGTLTADIYLKLADSPMILNAVSTLTVADRRKLATKETVPVVRKSTKGLRTEQVPIDRIRQHEIGQVFSGGRIRTPKEQEKAIVLGEPKGTTSLTVPLTNVQHDDMRQAAAEAGMTMAAHLADRRGSTLA